MQQYVIMNDMILNLTSTQKICHCYKYVHVFIYIKLPGSCKIISYTMYEVKWFRWCRNYIYITIAPSPGTTEFVPVLEQWLCTTSFTFCQIGTTKCAEVAIISSCLQWKYERTDNSH